MVFASESRSSGGMTTGSQLVYVSCALVPAKNAVWFRNSCRLYLSLSNLQVLSVPARHVLGVVGGLLILFGQFDAR